MENDSLNLYLVHCGFYDPEVYDGIYEGHVNLFVAAKNFDDAKANAKLDSSFQKKKMHVDGVLQIELVQGCRVQLVPDSRQGGQTLLKSHRHRDLARCK